MSIWIYEHQNASGLAGSYRDACFIRDCPFCGTALSHLAGREFFGNASACLGGDYGDYGKELKICSNCGWWVVTQLEGYMYGSYEGSIQIRRACGSLRNLDPADLSVPTKELQQYLLARYSDRHKLHPRKFEDIVAGVFSDFGYEVSLTSYSGDEGIDVYVLHGAGDSTVGVQVKRYGRKIEAEQIRSFVGALFSHGITAGVFVTTSGFRKGARQAARLAEARGIAVELWDAGAFYEKLRIVHRSPYDRADDPSAPFANAWNNIENVPLTFQAGF